MPGQRLLAICFSVLLVCLGIADSSVAGEHDHAHNKMAQSQHFDIPALPLADALKRYADQSGMQIFYRSDILPDITTQPLHGGFSHEQALMRLLAGSELRFTFGGNNALVIHSPEQEHYASLTPEPVLPNTPHSMAVEETYVTGIRNSLRLSLTEKRQAPNVIDVITSNDIGKFPDRNVADSLQRVAGVSVDRLWGEGRDVNIRGTDKDINRTLLNGQHVASSYWWANDNLSRGFNYSTLASQLVQSIEVHKTPRADIDEGSIGGTVIVRTRQPLSVADQLISVQLEQQYSELSAHWDPQASALGSWSNTDDTFGVLASFNVQNRRSRRDGQETFANDTLYTITEPKGEITQNVYAIWGGGTALLEQDRSHNTGNLTLQWAPDDHWNSVLNIFRSQMDIASVNHNYLFAPGGLKLRETPPATVTNPVFQTSEDGYLNLTGGLLSNADSTGALLDAIYRQGYIDTRVSDWETYYTDERWQLHWQLGHTESTGGTDHDYLYRFAGNTRFAFALSPDRVEVNYLDLDPKSASAMSSFSADSRDWIRAMENSETYGQIDIEYHPAAPWMSRLKAGLKRRDHGVVNTRILGEIDTNHPRWQSLSSTSLAAVSHELTPLLLPEVPEVSNVRQYVRTDARLLQEVIQPAYQTGLLAYRNDPSAYYRIEEDSLAAYVQGAFEFGHLHIDAGVRAVTTEQASSGYLGEQLVEYQRRYRHLLPSVNLRYQVGESTIVRASLAEVMARPNYEDIAPGLIVDPTSGSGLAGNPELNPYQANQADIGVEWYPSPTSLLAITAFYKDITSFVYPTTETRQIDGRTLNITTNRNSYGASISGIELRWQQDIAWGFGVQSNYTYTDAHVPSPEGLTAIKLPGNSRDQFNASVYYENARVDARLSYNYRSSSYGEVIAGSQSKTAAYSQLDGSLHWYLSNELSVSLEAINLNNEIIYIRSASGIPQGFYENGRRFLLGLRYQWQD